MRPRKKPRNTSITPPKPIIINILALRNLSAPRKHQFVFNPVLGIPRPKRLHDNPHAAVWREAEGGSCGRCGRWWFHRGIATVTATTAAGVCVDVDGTICPWRSSTRGLLASFGAFFPAPVAGAYSRGGSRNGTTSSRSSRSRRRANSRYRCSCRGRMIEVFIFQRTASDKVTDDDSLLTLVMILESDHDHSMAFDAATPAVVAVFFADFARGAEF